ncbi:hypothetical protein MKK75_33890 [Methylobacterium sp. J-030]|uniref:hypothetical protein n=1 Tax=Methylobacterium sp. J-030 TaxID=2836627 RepID=UPI001FB95E00|nr:hypothetical protein [Methylobacterium sp. J-030]MCJ2073728.1 hypothetical protein [Methylobacterium sp. J-030]
MDYVPSMAAVAAAQKSPHVDAIEAAASKAVSPVEPTALDPRPTYTLAPGAADAMLTLADMKTQAVGAAEFDTRYGHIAKVTEAATAAASAPVVSPEPTKVVSASSRNWNEDARVVHAPTRKVGTDTVVQYDTPRVMAAWSAAFPDIPTRKYRGLSPADTNVKPDLNQLLAENGAAILPSTVCLLCNADHYNTFSETHPHTHIDWIAVDNDEILLFWPKDAGHEAVHVSTAPMSDPEEAEQGGTERRPTAQEEPL